MIPFNKPYMTGGELGYIADAYGNRQLSGDGMFTRRCHEWLEQRTGSRKRALAALDGVALDGGQMLDVVVILTGHIRTLVDQTANNSEEDIAAGWAAVLETRADRFPHVIAALTSAARHESRDQGLEFGLDRILDGVQLYLGQQ